MQSVIRVVISQACSICTPAQSAAQHDERKTLPTCRVCVLPSSAEWAGISWTRMPATTTTTRKQQGAIAKRVPGPLRGQVCPGMRKTARHMALKSHHRPPPATRCMIRTMGINTRAATLDEPVRDSSFAARLDATSKMRGRFAYRSSSGVPLQASRSPMGRLNQV